MAAYEPIPPLISRDALQSRIAELGKQITADYAGKNHVKVIGALRGCFVFMADLIRAIEMPVKIDFMEISSYGKATVSSGNIKILKDLSDDPHGEHVLRGSLVAMPPPDRHRLSDRQRADRLPRKGPPVPAHRRGAGRVRPP